MLKTILYFLIRTFAAGMTVIVVWLFSFFSFDQTFFMSTVYSLLAGVFVYFGLKAYTQYRFRKQSGLTRREMKIVEQNLKESKNKIARLRKAFLKVQNLGNAKQNFETLRVVYKIYNNTKKEPKRFFLAEEFYFSHLDSIVELAERYTYLASQPAKTPELKASLIETRQTMDQVAKIIEQDLHHMLENDINTLHFEIDVAKKTIDRKK